MPMIPTQNGLDCRIYCFKPSPAQILRRNAQDVAEADGEEDAGRALAILQILDHGEMDAGVGGELALRHAPGLACPTQTLADRRCQPALLGGVTVLHGASMGTLCP